MADPKKTGRASGGNANGGDGEPEPTLATGRSIDAAAGDGPGRAQSFGTEQDPVWVRLRSSTDALVPHRLLWDVIRDRTAAIGFNRYSAYLEGILCRDELDCGYGGKQDCVDPCRAERRFYSMHGPDSYRILKAATECFLMHECGQYSARACQIWQGYRDGAEIDGTVPTAALIDAMRDRYLDAMDNSCDTKVLPYFEIIRGRLGEIPLKNGLVLGAQGASDGGCYGILRTRLSMPCMIELIWSYWHEEGMLAQTLNAIGLRFQNIRNPTLNDPLAHIAIDPLRGLNNLFWGYLQDEQNRLTVHRRAYEYEHHYGLNLLGKAAPKMAPVDRRSRFVEAFHNLLGTCTRFFKEVNNLQVDADGFPVLTALKEVHVLLAQGAHNQYGDLPWQSRVEMLMQQWLLGRPEFREFLGGRTMVPYTEPWMDRVDTMKNLQGWSDTSISVFNSLATTGEQILLSIRFTAWSAINDAAVASAWAVTWRSEIQNYIHAYRAATGVDLAAETRDADQRAAALTPPSILLSKRLANQKRAGALPPPASRAGLPAAARRQIPGPTPLTR
ncbi:MAG: hypothetical protein R3F55_15005 [Alphaproteobacteria bacterium]